MTDRNKLMGTIMALELELSRPKYQLEENWKLKQSLERHYYRLRRQYGRWVD